MKQKVVSYILLLFYLSVIVQPALPMVDYVVNYKHISEDLCVNKDKPEIQCHGKCHLKKEIKKAMGDENNPTKHNITLNNKLKEYANYYRKSTVTEYYSKFSYPLPKEIIVISHPLKGYLTQLFKPPEYVS